VPGSTDPFSHATDQAGHVTHGHLAENRHHGGSVNVGVKVKKFPECFTHRVVIGGFHYTPGDFTSAGRDRCAPTIRQGQSLTFVNADSIADGKLVLFGNVTSQQSQDYINSIFHSVTSCQYPCGLDTGISYPLANGSGSYDSGQLGPDTPAVGKLTWSTPTGLKPGTYTYFCRVHPFMRGVFRVIK